MKYLWTILVITIVFIYAPWFSFHKTLSSGDWPYLYREEIMEFKIPTQTPFLWLDPYYQITAKTGVELFHLSWDVTEKIFWFLPFIFISIFSSFKLLSTLFKKLQINKKLIPLGILIYSLNTYILMLVGGGQMGVALSYALAPLSLSVLINFISSNRRNLNNFIFSGLILALQLMFDPRVFVLTLAAFVLYSISLAFSKEFGISEIKSLSLLLLVSIGFNFFWIFANINYYHSVYSLIQREPLAKFLSFATFPNTISLLHPNWPENIFGKIGFMKPEFILIPILAFSSLFFVTLKNKGLILYLVMLGLLGAFAAKGINPPFGFVYDFFSNFPGASSFRDPTKFYLWIALSYSVLIPFTVSSLEKHIEKRLKLKFIPIIFIAVIFGYFLFLLKPALTQHLTGTFISRTVPKSYVGLKDFLVADKETFSTLWIPRTQRFSFSVGEKPALTAEDYFYPLSTDAIIKKLSVGNEEKDLKQQNIKYIIVPYDSLGEIFMEDRKYSDKSYQKIVNALSKINYLELIVNVAGKSKFGKIAVFKVN